MKYDLRQTIKKAIKLLGKDRVCLIAHAQSFPSSPNENTGQPAFLSGAKLIVENLKDFFNYIQLGPMGITKLSDNSPYSGSLFSINPLFIDLKELTIKKWGNILSTKTFNSIVEKNPNKNSYNTAYEYAYEQYDKAIREAFSNFQKKPNKIINLKFEKFKKQEADWLDKDALYEALSVHYNNDHYKNWASEIDKNLFSLKTSDKARKVRIAELNNEHKNEIELYKFTQFVANEQLEEAKAFAIDNGVKFIADRQVATSDRDIWGRPDIFLKDKKLGCPPDYFSKQGQAWGFAYPDPHNAEAEKFLYDSFRRMFEQSPGGVRVDHIIGFIDPFVYNISPVKDGTRLFSSPDILPEYAKISADKIDHNYESGAEDRIYPNSLDEREIKNYGKYIEIIMKAAEDAGVDPKKAIIAEDLGTLTNPVKMLMEHYGLGSMKVTQFNNPEEADHVYRVVQTAKEKDLVTAGTHDNEALMSWAKRIAQDAPIAEGIAHATQLAEDLNISDREKFIHETSRNPVKLFSAKIAELFVSKATTVQLFFADFLGMTERYNIPGTVENNWRLRMPDDFAERVNEINENGINPTKIMAEALAMAIKAKGDDFAKENETILNSINKIVQASEII